ncbi:HAD family hydrolase [Thioalkalivibrio sp. ALE9]|uniref:HAD family hydrolase n=1 Tax=Thioalkalivibrio sp. ALE9 TaxID=1158169 RepID=UPI00056EE52A|nr:HAD family hydrolase [Thioalkalivibrio sp. ALE9]
MQRRLSDYRTFVFDCDGVLLDSNRVKTDAFYEAALPYGEDAARELVRYHREHGGVSRQRKFGYFLERIVGECPGSEEAYDELLKRYARCVREGLASCAVAEGAEELLERLPGDAWRYVVSGGAEDEVRWVLAEKGLVRHFHGIYGNPQDKADLVERAAGEHGWAEPSLFVGDARYDHEVAIGHGMDFLFVSGYSEFVQWPEYVDGHDVACVAHLSEVIP